MDNDLFSDILPEHKHDMQLITSKCKFIQCTKQPTASEVLDFLKNLMNFIFFIFRINSCHLFYKTVTQPTASEVLDFLMER